jgi:hypothetical protein
MKSLKPKVFVVYRYAELDEDLYVESDVTMQPKIFSYVIAGYVVAVPVQYSVREANMLLYESLREPIGSCGALTYSVA